MAEMIEKIYDSKIIHKFSCWILSILYIPPLLCFDDDSTTESSDIEFYSNFASFPYFLPFSFHPVKYQVSIMDAFSIIFHHEFSSEIEIPSNQIWAHRIHNTFTWIFTTWIYENYPVLTHFKFFMKISSSRYFCTRMDNENLMVNCTKRVKCRAHAWWRLLWLGLLFSQCNDTRNNVLFYDINRERRGKMESRHTQKTKKYVRVNCGVDCDFHS